MNSNRKAEIQRKLTLTAVPKPPDGLADRIKGDIPKYLHAMEAERQRFSRSVAFNMRVAASILLLVTSLFVTIRLFDSSRPPSSASLKASAPQRPATLAEAKKSTPEVDELRVEISEESRPVLQVAQTTAPEAPRSRRDAGREEGFVGGVEGGVVGGVVGGSVGGRVADADAPSAVPQPASPPVAEPMPTAVAETITVTGAAPKIENAARQAASTSFVKEAVASDLALGPRQSVFGISIDPDAFERIKSTIEKGGRPTESAVNVEALVNYFAGAPKRVRRDVSLEAEGSPAPVDVNGRRGILRFTVDTRTDDVAQHASIPPIATDARVEVAFNGSAVASFRRIGDEDAISPEATLLGNTSVTALYEVELKPGTNPHTRIATITLHYKSIADRREKSRFVVVHASDFARKWTLASRRHRLASLGAVWGESLKGGGSGTDVAVRAEELVTQSPGDAKARELAAAANASAGSER